MLQGYATSEGTGGFAASSPAGRSNYRTFGSLTLSSVGMGTYLGESDDATDAAVEGAVAESVRRGVNVLDTAINYRSRRPRGRWEGPYPKWCRMVQRPGRGCSCPPKAAT